MSRTCWRSQTDVAHEQAVLAEFENQGYFVSSSNAQLLLVRQVALPKRTALPDQAALPGRELTPSLARASGPPARAASSRLSVALSRSCYPYG